MGRLALESQFPLATRTSRCRCTQGEDFSDAITQVKPATARRRFLMWPVHLAGPLATGVGGRGGSGEIQCSFCRPFSVQGIVPITFIMSFYGRNVLFSNEIHSP